MKKLLLLCFMLLTAGYVDAQSCTASLNAVQSPSGNNLLNVNFTNSSNYGLPFTGQAKDFYINYGDGNTLSNYPGTAVPSHVYAAPGTYTIGFRIRSYDSASNTTICTDTTTITVTVTYPPCGSRIFVSGFGATRTFTANTPAGTTGMNYSWNYGDGNTGTGTPVSHTYAASGTYTVTLIATAGSGPTACTYVNFITVVIYIPPPPLNCGTLHAAFNVTTSGNVVSFTNTSNIASGAYQTTATWDYGDGTTSTGFNSAPHTYSAIGVYTIKLKMHWQDSLNTTSCNDSTTRTVSITSIPTPPNIISGNIIYDTTNGTRYFKVYLIQYDSATQWLSAVDSVTTGNTASPYYAFGSKPAGNYRVKAVVQGTFSSTGFIPTYHDSSVYWSSANVILHNGGTTINQRVYVLHGTATTGTGFIGGNVSYGANKGNASGGVANMLIYLRDANMRVIQMAYTDSLGNYSFTNIPFGPYSVWPELMNYTTMPVTPLQIIASNPSRNDINFNVDDNKLSIAPRSALGVNNQSVASDYMTVAPVPASGNVTITWYGRNDETAQFVITNMTGQVVACTGVLQGHSGSVNINLAGMASGVYFVHGSGSLAGKVQRLVVE